MRLIAGIQDHLSLHVLTPLSRWQRLARPSTSPTLRAFYRGLRLRRQMWSWDEEQRRQWMLDQLRATLRYAYRETVYYRELWDSVGFDPNVEFDFNMFAQLPVLTREDIHNAGPSLLARSVPKDQLRRDATGGSTGMPTEIWLGPNERGWNAGASAFFTESVGVPEGSRTALLWGHHLDTHETDSFRERVNALISNQRWFDSMRLSSDVLDQYHRELQAWRPACIIAYASALGQLAEHLIDQKLQPLYPTKCLITGAEKLWSRHREQIQKAFGLPVHERYGGRDIGWVGFQMNPEDGMAYDLDWPKTFVEPETEDRETSILVTKLQADGMPMIRYRVDDVGRFPVTSRPGHPTFALEEVLGRVTDRLWLPNESWISGLHIPHLLKDFPVREFLLHQLSDYTIDLKLVPQADFSRDHERSILNILKNNLPGLEIRVSLVDRIDRTNKANKWSPVISEVERGLRKATA